jgi:CheY-like chemotaxis protein
MKRPTILCVDDEEIVLSSLETELRHHLGNSYIIEVADNGEDALELLEELMSEGHEIMVVISDYIMPGIKGDELLKKIHDILPETLKIMLTGQSTTEAVANVVNYAKLYRYITKPWQAEDLALTVQGAIKSYLQNKELNRKIQVFEKFVPSKFLKILEIEDYADIELGKCAEREMSIMFCDIRSFTTLSERMSLQQNFAFINGYLSRMGPIIRQYNGVIDKYIGDAIMALFESADDALQAATQMLFQLIEYNQGRIRAGYVPLSVGIGLNTGQLMLGTIGESDRMETTVIGDTVNIASRVEGLTKIYNNNLLITERTYKKLVKPSQYHIRVIDAVQIKGKSEIITVYEVFDADSAAEIELKEQTRESFEQGFVLYHSEEPAEAYGFFQKVLQVNENDEVARVYLDRCRKIAGIMDADPATILVIDDQLLNVRVLTHLLTRNNFKVLIAQSGEEALQMIQQQPPDMILLDVLMPGIDGFETCQRLKADSTTQNIPIIFMTALTDVADKVRAFKLGAVDYITKPFQQEELLARVYTHLTIRRLQSHLKDSIQG